VSVALTECPHMATPSCTPSSSALIRCTRSSSLHFLCLERRGKADIRFRDPARAQAHSAHNARPRAIMCV
jgi:hypothetical protein